MKTVYQCCQRASDVNKTPVPVHYADTQHEAMTWLENNGGGTYRNLLHKFELHVPAAPVK